jgi:hypothetical protein
MNHERVYQIFRATPAAGEGMTAREIATTAGDPDVKYVESALGTMVRDGEAIAMGPLWNRRYLRAL